MCGNSLHGNREIPPSPTDEHVMVGRSQKVKDPKCDMHDDGKSDDCVVPEKSPNRSRTFWGVWEEINAPLAQLRAKREEMEGRRSTEGNAEQTATGRTQSRYTVSSGLQRVRNAARRDKRAQFTCLLPHVTVDLLRESYRHLKKDAAPGVDDITWKQYGVGLEDRLLDLHTRVHTGRYRAQPSKRIYQEKPDGRLRPIGIAVVEDKVVQHAVVKVLSAIYEEDFLGFSYGFRPGRSQHDALDALWVAIMEKKVNWVLDADIRSFLETASYCTPVHEGYWKRVS
jgi:RNA-directed DNA polymerase